jgi:glycosyltransferase involved in cell wall biosynthesis
MSFFREVLPDTPMIGFFEYYYSAHGGPVGFDPSEPVSDHSPFLLAANNVVPLANINIVDLAHSPTQWQCDRFPTSFHDKMYVCHDGIRTDKLRPNKRAKVTLGCVDRPLTVKDEIVTFMARNLETTRGYQQFMRALPHIQKARPNARIMVIGGNDASYGKPTQYAGGLRGKMEAEVGHLLDWDRLHFLGQAPFESYQKIIQISSCHIYLTMPFILSWSFLECMAKLAFWLISLTRTPSDLRSSTNWKIRVHLRILALLPANMWSKLMTFKPFACPNTFVRSTRL